MRVFFDNCTSPVLAETLNGYLRHRSDSASHIRDLPCGRHASDLDWMAYLAGTGDDWLVVTGDKRIHNNKAERAAFRQAGLKGLVLAAGYQKTPIHQQASFLIWRWPDIDGLLENLRPPFLFEIPMKRQAGFRQLPV
ncbi:PIN-like domain-containing protein [Methylobacterium brachiatum]|uniref:VapC45 PIN like domain-containing protein n=1 Tax=Methylobacterium brachiatum TaxID=269660 RepID=A0ABV1RA66_9HYPH